jgi:hypothetical protein
VPLRRFGRPGLLGNIGPDAVIAGTAAMTSRVVQHQPERAADQQAAERQESALEPHGAATSRSAEASPPDLVGQLSQLAELRSSGALTGEEFRSAKARLLTS